LAINIVALVKIYNFPEIKTGVSEEELGKFKKKMVGSLLFIPTYYI
jgi:hypothetical protein